MFILGETAPKTGGDWKILVILGILMVGMLFMSIIPQKKRQKKAQEMMASIKVGVKIKTIGGFVGQVVTVNDSEGTFTLDISANNDGSTLVMIDKSAVYTVLVPAPTGELVEQEKAEEVVASDDLIDDQKSKAKKKNKKDNQEEIVVENNDDLKI